MKRGGGLGHGLAAGQPPRLEEEKGGVRRKEKRREN